MSNCHLMMQYRPMECLARYGCHCAQNRGKCFGAPVRFALVRDSGVLGLESVTARAPTTLLVVAMRKRRRSYGKCSELLAEVSLTTKPTYGRRAMCGLCGPMK